MRSRSLWPRSTPCLESQKLLEKLKQNNLGGLILLELLRRLSGHRGGTASQPSLWFSKAHFETRSHVKLEGEGVNVSQANTLSTPGMECELLKFEKEEEG